MRCLRLGMAFYAQCIIYCEMSEGNIQEVSYSWIKQNNAKWPAVGTGALLVNTGK